MNAFMKDAKTDNYDSLKLYIINRKINDLIKRVIKKKNEKLADILFYAIITN